MKTLDEIRDVLKKCLYETNWENNKGFERDAVILFNRQELPDGFIITFLCTNCNKRWEVVLKKYDEVRTTVAIWLYVYHKGVTVPLDDSGIYYYTCPTCGTNNDIIVHDRKPL